MRRNNLDLMLASLIAACNVGWALLPNHLLLISIIFALPIVFLLPGYTLTEALFKRTSAHAQSLIVQPRTRIVRALPISDRLVFSLGLSLVIDITTGLVLDVLPMGLQQSSWAIALSFLTAIFALVAAYRRRGPNEKQNERPGSTQPRFRLSLYEYMLIGLALLITVSSVWYSAHSALQQEQQTSFTQFWMVSSKQANASCAVLIGVQSFEARSTTYSVVLTANGVPLSKWSPVVLAPQEEWYQSVPITSKNSNTIALDAMLYRRASQSGMPYRETHLTLTSTGGGNDHTLQC